MNLPFRALVPALGTFCCLTALAVPTAISDGPENDYESWIGRLDDGRLLVIFDRNPDWQSGDLYRSVSEDDGASWSSPEPVITVPGDQATLCFQQLPDLSIHLWYASNESGDYRIHAAHSADAETWTEDGQVDLGWWAGIDYYDPTVALEPDGSLTMCYVVSGLGAYVARKPAGGSWDTDRRLVATGGQRARIMKHGDGTYVAVYHKRSGPSQYDYDVFLRTSMDLDSWSPELRMTTNLNSHDPFVGEMCDGSYRLYYAKYSPPAYNLFLRRSWNAVDWDPEEQVTSDAVNNTQPHFLAEPGLFHLVWAHAVSYPYDHDVYYENSDCPAGVVEDLQIALAGDGVLLSWSHYEAATFKIYSGPEPYGDLPQLEGVTTETELLIPGALEQGRRYYAVRVVH